MKRIFVVAGEASGDMYAGAVISALRKENPDLEIEGWGGEAMAEAGARVRKHYREMAFMGFWEVAKNLRTIKANFDLAHDQIEASAPDLLLTIDFPGFNLRLARWAHERGIQTAHYISPAIWAWKAGRIRSIRRDVDHMFVTLPFEQEIYDKAGVPCSFVGHPLLEMNASEDQGFPLDDRPVLALLPGSRSQEIAHLLPVMLDAATAFDGIRAVVAGAPGADPTWYRMATEQGVEVVFDATRSLLRQARAGLVTSGTATLEAGLAGMPTIICYKTSRLTYLIAKHLAQVDHIGLPNIILKRTVFPERIQHDCSATQLKKDLAPLLAEDETPQRREMLAGLADLHERLGSRGAARRVASKLLQMLGMLLLLWRPAESLSQEAAPVLKVGIHAGESVVGWQLRVPESIYQTVNPTGHVLDTLPTGQWLTIGSGASALPGSEPYLLLRPTSPGDVFELKPPGQAPQMHAGALHLDGRGGRQVRAILETSLESYLPGVLSAEAGKGHGLAYYEAQAIVSRTYTIQAQHRHRVEGFHVCDRVHCQVYHGLTTATDTMFVAVANTRHQVLIDNAGRPITAAFHSNCGGHTQGAEAVWQTSLPYLRCVRDTFCARGAHSHWEQTIDGERWRAWLAEQRGGRDDGPSSMFPTERSPHLLDSTVAIRAAEARSAFGLPSAFFVAHDTGAEVALIGQGFGHGIGLCQEGAMARARAGASAWDILNAYYQQIHLADSRPAWRLVQRLGR